MGNFVLDMQTDAVRMTLEEFTDKYGVHNAYVWQQQHYTWDLPESVDTDFQ